MARRRAAFGAEMARAGVSHALVYGANRSGGAVSWLAGWPVTREALLVLGPDPADDVLLVGYFNHVPQARRVSLARVEPAGPRPVAAALDLIAARGPLPGRVGVAGALPFDQYLTLAQRVPGVTDLNQAHARLRLVKSAEEIAALRHAAALTDGAVAALAQALVPGATDHEVLAAVEAAYTARGGLHHIHYLGITAMDPPAEPVDNSKKRTAPGADAPGPGTPEAAVAVPAQWPTGRVIRAGDVVSCEISAAVAPEYAGQLLRTFTVAAPAAARYAELHAVAEAAFAAMAALLVPGTTAAELAAAGAAVLGAAGFTAIDDLAHGFGGGYLAPVVPAPGRPLAAPGFTLEAGMTVVVQPNVVTPDGQAGVQTGELLLVTGQGPERLHGYPRGLRRAG